MAGRRVRRWVSWLLAATLSAAGLIGVTAVPASAAPVGVPYGGSGGRVVGWGSSVGEIPPAATYGVVAIATGGFHGLALKRDGTVMAWGGNGTGQTNVPAGLSGVAAIAAGGFHSLALKADGTVVAWGSNDFGQTDVPAGLSGVKAIAAGGYHSLALKDDGTVVAWGYDRVGQTDVPAGLSGVSAIAAGGYQSLALKQDGTVVAWGGNGTGQSSVPAGLSGVTAIAAGGYHSLALKLDGSVVAWGWNAYGQRSVPADLRGVSAIAAGYAHSLALKTDGTVVAWGSNVYGMTSVPATATGATAIAGGSQLSLALVGVGFGAASPPDRAVYGSPYSYQYAASIAGTPVTTYSVSAGSLPPGLALNPNTGLLSGEPTAAGSFSFRVRAADGTGPTANYADSPPTQITVEPRPFSVTVSSAAITYGDPEPAYGYTLDGLLPGDSLTDQGTCGVAGPHSAAGTYVISCRGVSAGPNYRASSVENGRLTVARRAVTVTAADATAVYGDPDPAFGYRISGLINGDALTAQPSCGVSVAHRDAGTYPIGCAGASAGDNYRVSYGAGSLRVTPAAVTVRADSRSIVYGDPVPAFTSTTTGLVGSDRLIVAPTCGVVGPHARAGRYPIVCAGAEAGANYTVTHLPGVLTVATRPGVVTADPQSIVYGQSDPAFTYTVSGLKDGDSLTTSPTCGVAVAHRDVGTYPIVCTGGGSDDYRLSYVGGTLTVTKAIVRIAADHVTKVYGTADPVFTSTTSGLVGADRLTTAPTCGVAVVHADTGSYPVVCAGADAGGNYAVMYLPGTLTVSKAATTLTVDAVITSLLHPAATLARADTGAKIAGQTIVFTTGGHPVCSAVTDAQGVARCQRVHRPVTRRLAASFAGSLNYLGSTDSAGILGR